MLAIWTSLKVYNNKNRGSRPKTKLKDEFRRDEEFVMWRLKNWSTFSLLCLNGFLGHMNGGTSYSSLYLLKFFNKSNLVLRYPQYWAHQPLTIRYVIPHFKILPILETSFGWPPDYLDTPI